MLYFELDVLNIYVAGTLINRMHQQHEVTVAIGRAFCCLNGVRNNCFLLNCKRILTNLTQQQDQQRSKEVGYSQE